MTGILTLDSLLAMVVTLVVITASLYLVSSQKISSEEYLYQFSSDVLSIAEKKEYLRKAVNGDSSGISKLNSSLPSSICFDLEIVNETDNTVFYYNKAGCSPLPCRYSQAKRLFVSDSKFYVSTLKAWYK